MEVLYLGSIVKDDKGEEYSLVKFLNNGGFGCVFLAERISDKMCFAVKTFLPVFKDSKCVDAFRNEIAMSADISGKNIIRYEYVHNGDTFKELPLYIIMEYADNGTLRDILDERKKLNKLFSLDELINIYKQLISGMEIINSKLVHRDVKPENILICGKILKITDFGLAKISAENTRTMTFKGGGTPLYMAPEAWDYSKNTIQMDIYSMGIIFYELATLHYPYALNSSNSNDEYRSCHLYSPVTNPQIYNSNLNPSFVSIINRMLEKKPKKRFEKWSDISEALEKFINSEQMANEYSELVNTLVSSKNIQNIEKQRQESIRIKKETEQTEFVKLIKSQIVNEIILPLQEFIEDVNLKYSGDDKFAYTPLGENAGKKCSLIWRLLSSNNNILQIRAEAIFKEDYTDVYEKGIMTRTIINNPKYKNNDVIACCEITNSIGNGFNLILVQNDDLYGNWYIMDNHNNFSFATSDKERREPFAFSINELPKEINLVQITHLYRADFLPFETKAFLERIQLLIINI